VGIKLESWDIAPGTDTLRTGYEPCRLCFTPFSQSYIAFGIQYIFLATNPSNLVSLKRIDVDSGTYYGATLANTVVSTILIIWRVHAIGGTESVARYWRVLGMVVESAALYSIVLIIYMPFVTGTDYATHAATYIVQSVVIPMTVRISGSPLTVN
jgi:hypothetical protein